MKISIYVLKHPITFEIRYVGKTSNKLNDRLSSHIWEARKSGRKNRRIAWIKSILNLELRPIIEEVDFAETNEEANRKERHYISTLQNLVNSQPGGDGNPPGYKFKKRYVPPKGIQPSHLKEYKPWSTGKPLPKLVREKISKKQKGITNPKKLKAVDVINTETKAIITFDSVKAAAVFLDANPSDISECCTGKSIRYFNEIYTVVFHRNKIPKTIKRYRTKVIVFDENSEVIYNSKLEASKDQGIDRKTIDQLLESGKKDKNGKNWSKVKS